MARWFGRACGAAGVSNSSVSNDGRMMWLFELSRPALGRVRAGLASSLAIATLALVMLLAPVLFATSLLASSAVAFPVQQQPAIDTDEAIQIVDVGFQTKFKVGSWTPIHIVVDPTMLGADRVSIEVQTIDGDGVPVTHRDAAPFDLDEMPRDASGWVSIWRSIRIGRLRSDLVVRVVSDGGLVLASRSLDLAPESGALESTHGLIVGLGPEIGFRQWMNDRQGKIEERSYEFVPLQAADLLPTSSLAYDSVDLLIVAIGDGTLIEADSGVPWEAIVQWVERGGVMLLCGAEGAEALSTGAHPLGRLIPGTIGRATRVTSSAGAETFVSANDQLLARGESYVILPIENPTGKILAYERVDNSSVPLVVDSTRGMGRVLWLGADPSAAPLNRWSSRTRLLGRLVETLRASTYGREQTRGGRVTSLGYADLGGQLHSALDRYQRVSLVTFTGVAAVVVVFILLIGPLDYYLVTRLLKRPELTWVTSSVLIIGLTLFAAFAFQMTKGNSILANQLEMIDIDASTGQTRGTVWTQLYSPRVRQFDLSLDRRDEFRTDAGETVLSWQGFPGSGLAGMDQSTLSVTSQGAYGMVHTDRGVEIDGVAVQVASSRALMTRWWDQFPSPIRHRLYIPPRNNSLHGDFTNPFPFTLDQAVVFYDTSAYILNEDIQPGETFSIEGQTTERTIEALLARRQFVQGSERSEAWDTTNSNLNRISQVLAFHEAAGGRNYTTLTNLLHAEMDWSPQLKLGQAVLYAQCVEPVSRLVDGETVLEEQYDQRVTIVRVILPVEVLRSTNN